MAETKKTKLDKTLSSEISVLDSLLDPTSRLAKKYIMDAEGRLKLYHPVVQRALWRLITEDGGLMEELKEYHAEKKCKDRVSDCEKSGV